MAMTSQREEEALLWTWFVKKYIENPMLAFTSKAIASDMKIDVERTRRILQRLRKQGWVTTTDGGGWSLNMTHEAHGVKVARRLMSTMRKLDCFDEDRWRWPRKIVEQAEERS